MGYPTHVEGGFEIAPPLRFDELEASPFTHHHGAGEGSEVWRAPDIDLDLVVELTEKPIEGGVAFLYSGVRLVMQELDDYRTDAILMSKHVQHVVNLFDDDHTYAGQLTGQGQDGAGQPVEWRLGIDDDGDVYTDRARMLYREDVTEEQRVYAARLLRRLAVEVEALPQDFELDPGRGEVRQLLRDRAEQIESGK